MGGRRAITRYGIAATTSEPASSIAAATVPSPPTTVSSQLRAPQPAAPATAVATTRRATPLNSADPNKPTVKPVPYVGVQFVAIPEFQGLGTSVGEIFSAALAGQKTADVALGEAQSLVTDEMKAAGYIK